ncbi:hypothetical protein ACWKSP_21140 [Micromonosporaceae bacterium Da 78-11]
MDEGVQGGRVVGVNAGHPGVEVSSSAGIEQAGELADAGCQDAQMRAYVEKFVEVATAMMGQFVGWLISRA